MARLFAAENFPLPVTTELRRLGHDIVTMSDAGQAGQAVPDQDVLAFARAEGRALMTLNRKHYIRLHLADPDHQGIVVCTFDPDFVGQGSRIDSILKDCPSLVGQLLRVNRPGPS